MSDDVKALIAHLRNPPHYAVISPQDWFIRAADTIERQAAELDAARAELAQATDASGLLFCVSEIRRRTGIGGKPMLSELPDAIMAKMDRVGPSDPANADLVAQLEALIKHWQGLRRPPLHACPDELEAILKGQRHDI